jgi:hypothetical protein
MNSATRTALHLFMFIVLLFRFETHSWSQITTEEDQSIGSVQKENERLKQEIDELKKELEKTREMPDGIASADNEGASEMHNKRLVAAILEKHHGEITSQKAKVTSLQLQTQELDEKLREIQRMVPQTQQIQITEYINKLTSLDAEFQRVKARIPEKIPGNSADKNSIEKITKIIYENDEIIKQLSTEVSVLEKVPSEFILPTDFSYRKAPKGYELTLLRREGELEIPLPGRFINVYTQYFDGPERLIGKIQTDMNGFAMMPNVLNRETPKNTFIVFRFVGEKLLRPCEIKKVLRR